MSVPLLALLLSWHACLHARAAVQTVTIPNDTGQVANNLEIVFSQPLDVGLQNSKTTANPFTTVALNGLSPNEYTFRGATVAPGGSATVSWSPGGTIVSGYWSQTIDFTNAVMNLGPIHLPVPSIYGNIPVVINIYTNAITPEKASNSIAQASAILMQAGFKLTIVQVNTNFSGNGTDTNGNYNLNDPGRTNLWLLVTNAQNVLSSNIVAMGKGIVVDFLSNSLVLAGSNYSPGWSVHRKPMVVTQDRGNTNANGQTIAHEIGHIMSLAGTNVVIGMQGTNVIYGDPSGHAPNIPGTNGQGNFMAPSNYRTNSVINPSQKAEMNKEATNRVATLISVAPNGPASVVELQRGAAFFTLPQNAAYPPYYNVESVSLSSANGDDDIAGQIQLFASLAPGASGAYGFALDTDDNPATGEDLGPFAGIEYIVQINVDWPETNPAPTLSGLVQNLETSQQTLLSDTPFIANELLLNDSTNLEPLTVAQTIQFTLPKALLGLPSTLGTGGPPVIPVGLFTTINSPFQNIPAGDMFLFNLYEWESWPQLSVGLSKSAARTFTYVGSGLTSNSIYQLSVDGANIDIGTIPGSGQIQGQFLLSTGLSMTVPHFVTAQDGTGRFAWSLTPPLPPQLAIKQSTNSLFRVSWQAPWQAYFPLTSTSLASNAVWYLVGGQVMSAEGNQYVDIPSGLPPRFILLSTALPAVTNNTVQGPFYLVNTTSKAVDGFQGVANAGGTLNNPQMTAGPLDAVIGASGNQVNIVFPTLIQPGTSLGFTVNSQTASITFSYGVWTFQGQIVGTGVPTP